MGVACSRSGQSHSRSMLRGFTRLPQARIFKCLGYKSISILRGFTHLPPTRIFKCLGDIVTAKYLAVQPLYRQLEILKRSGSELSWGTLANGCVQLGTKVNVIVQAMRSHLLLETSICADETWLQVLKEQDRDPQTKSYMWVYRSGEFTEKPVVIYDYQPSRSARCAADFLGYYAGYLLSDGHTAYNCLDGGFHGTCAPKVHRLAKITADQKSRESRKSAELHRSTLWHRAGKARSLGAWSPKIARAKSQTDIIPITLRT